MGFQMMHTHVNDEGQISRPNKQATEKEIGILTA